MKAVHTAADVTAAVQPYLRPEQYESLVVGIERLLADTREAWLQRSQEALEHAAVEVGELAQVHASANKREMERYLAGKAKGLRAAGGIIAEALRAEVPNNGVSDHGQQAT